MLRSSILEKLKNKIYLIAGDASPRKFYRFKESKGKILIYCKRNKKSNLENYVKINKFLQKKKISVPKTFTKNIKKDYIITEDLGDKSLKLLVKQNKKPINIFKTVINQLVELQKIKTKPFIPIYSKNLLQKELNLFYNWYLPEFFNQKKVKEVKSQINKILSPLLSNVTKKNKFFVHRDFHLENLMMYKKKISLIDTQDAVIGHRAYDLASLIDDVRLNIKKSDQDAIFNHYIKKSPNLDKDFSEHFHILSIQRLLKILGIFVRLYRRDKKEKYLKYLNYTWKLIDRRLMHSSLKNLNIIFKKNFNQKIKNKKWK